MESTTSTISDYVAEQGITATAVYVGETVESSTGAYSYQRWSYTRHHYRVTLHRGEDSTPEFDYSQGEAITNEPSERPDEILDALVSDATSGEETFEDFAANFGYDEDSRAAYATWEACQKVGEWLQRFLGDDFERVAYELERL